MQVYIKDLIPYINNSRTHSEQQINQIAASIKEFGFLNPVIIDKDNGIIAGHGRILAAQKIGIEQVPAVKAEHLTETQKKAYIIADNQLALNAGWDMDLLKVEIEGLKELDFDTELLGFDEDFLDGLLFEENQGLTDEDYVPEAPEEPITKFGDLWILGNHRLLCGDSTNIDHATFLMGGEIADMVFTDPPYGVSYKSNMRVKSDKFELLMNDDKILDFLPIVETLSRGWVFVWTSWKVISKWLDQLSSLGSPTNQIIWHKPGGGIGDLKKTFSSDYEVGLVWNRGAELCGKRIGSVWKISKDFSGSYKHPTQKPVALAEEAIDKTTRVGNSVLDLFGGSGSTLIACEKISRKAFLMELDPQYCDVIIKRWQDYTGKEAILESTGETYNKLAGEK